MADGKFTQNTKETRTRKANECIFSAKQSGPPDKLFDEFWREGELGLLFGPQGVGKSILAVQIAEGIARGRAIDGFVMTGKRHKVLYVDLRLSERQFGRRYENEGKQYKLSENLYHDRPALNKPLCEWLRGQIRENGFRVIVIDDLSAVRMTYDGTRETLKLMRELKQLKDELDVSVLVLAGSDEQRKGELISEAHLKRSRVLCDVADSTFAMGVHAGNPQYRYVVQTRSQSAAIKWNAGNSPICSIQRSDDGFLEMAFDERFVAEVDEETRQLICNIKWAHDAGSSYREIAEELGIARSTAFRLHKKWTAALEKDIGIEPEKNVQNSTSVLAQDCDEKEEWNECGFEKPLWLEGEGAEDILPRINADNADRKEDVDPRDPRSSAAKNCLRSYPADVSAIPFMAALKRIHVTDLKRGVDGYGREIFIEKECEYNGRPIIWYQYDSKGNLYRKERDSLGISITRLESPWIAAAYACLSL